MARSFLRHGSPASLGLAALALTGLLHCGGKGSTSSGTTSSTTGSSTTGSGAGGSGGTDLTTSSSTTGSGGSTTTTTTATTTTSTTTTGSGAGGMGGNGGNGGNGGTGGDPLDADNDHDGWSVNQGDCCDTQGACSNPELVNPGAYEYLGNLIDDDCDPSTQDNVPAAACSPPALQAPTNSDDLIKAMDLCQFTQESPPQSMKKWGVIQTWMLRADGTALPAPKDLQAGVLASYGPNVMPKSGSTMAALSSGTARTPTDAGYVHPQNGVMAGQIGNFNANTQVPMPAAWLAAHNGVVPNPANCPACQGAACGQAFDSINLKARIRVPTNARSFSYSLKFYTAEYPEFVCKQFNDFFITLLSSQWVPDPNANPPQQPLPLDKNIAFDGQKNAVSVNNSFLEVCFPPAGAPPGVCPGGTLELVGTGMGGWGNNLQDGGGTQWLINDSPVKPGETIEIQWMIWDAGDHNVDSLVLLDKFRWSITPSTVGVHK
jgi:hypothetical protein